MPATNPTAADEVAFLSGVDASGTVVTDTFATLNGEASHRTAGNNTAPTYSATSSTAAKFGSTTAGPASGTISFAFNPASNYTSTEQSVYLSSMALWSAEANVTFAAATDYATALLQFTRGSDGSAYASPRGGNASGLSGSPQVRGDNTMQSRPTTIRAGAVAFGIDQIWAAVTSPATLDPGALSAACAVLGPVRPVGMLQPQILPRNANGKVLKGELRALAIARRG